ncbi:MAG: hypothetical protein M3296_00355 [Actinomycetota bacterium]|nr:hypothetical protein [Actinomycetota bacterium]
MPVLVALFGWNSQDWTDTFGLVVIFFVMFPVLVQGLLAFAAMVARGERAENEKHAGRWGRRPDSE